jgi:hypothetical protein
MSPATWFLEQEARALLTRLDQVRPFVQNETMILAAAPPPTALSAIEELLLAGRRDLRLRVLAYLTWLRGPGASADATEQQRRFTVIRLAFNDVLSQLDLFAEVITQRSENGNGVWLSGLDVLAADGLQLAGGFFEPPPVVCYLARGPGAAIRRARTRLPGGIDNPVAVIRVPRERMVSHGIASSLLHEVGHQAAALLGLVESLRPELLAAERAATPALRPVWQSWQRWISEILADLWSVSKLGIGSTLGLIGVVSLPRWFVFRPSGQDPHPIPWVRVRLSAAIGAALYPHPQWGRVAALWSSLYPLESAPKPLQEPLALMDSAIPAFVDRMLAHRPASLRGAQVSDVLRHRSRRAESLLSRLDDWRRNPQQIDRTAPSLAFAVVGQARAADLMSPEYESRLLSELLTRWAVRGSLDSTLLCAAPRTRPAMAAAS